ncbi:hypothetical protein F5Y16DRAFT_394234 [Xylariaceae sp. FL0255]|nr:hypothetical protein F5Y16DRAFT_394234 [Xylariaceae sp. FL0255]
MASFTPQQREIYRLAIKNRHAIALKDLSFSVKKEELERFIRQLPGFDRTIIVWPEDDATPSRRRTPVYHRGHCHVIFEDRAAFQRGKQYFDDRGNRVQITQGRESSSHKANVAHNPISRISESAGLTTSATSTSLRMMRVASPTSSGAASTTTPTAITGHPTVNAISRGQSDIDATADHGDLNEMLERSRRDSGRFRLNLRRARLDLASSNTPSTNITQPEPNPFALRTQDNIGVETLDNEETHPNAESEPVSSQPQDTTLADTGPSADVTKKEVV